MKTQLVFQPDDLLGGKLRFVAEASNPRPLPARPWHTRYVRVRCECSVEFTCALNNIRTGNTSQCKPCGYRNRSKP